MRFWIPQSKIGQFLCLATFAAVMIGAIVLGTLAGNSDVNANNDLSRQMGVQQVQGQEWAPFSAHEIRAARAYMKAHPVPLKPGEVQAAIIRTVVSAGDGTAPCRAWGDCWKALVVFSSDSDPLAYHIVNGYGGDLGFFQACYKTGDFIILNWRAMQSQPTTLENEPDLNNIARLSWIRSSYTSKARCVIRAG